MHFAAAVATLATLAMAGPDKPAMDPPFDRQKLSNNLKANLQPTQSNKDYWDASWIPEGCKDMAKSQDLDANDFTAFNVHYDDCSEAWTFCRHKDYTESEDEMIDNFGRLPVRVRSFIRHFIGLPDQHKGFAAITVSAADTAFVIYPYVDTLMHEITHSMDTHAFPDKSDPPFSEHPEWTDEYAKDSHSVTDYARTSWEEDMAEAAMVAIYDKIVPNGFGGLASNWEQVFHQYATYQYYFNDIIQPGGQCQNRIPNSAPVPKSDNKKMAAGTKPEHRFKAENNITEINTNVPHKVWYNYEMKPF